MVDLNHKKIEFLFRFIICPVHQLIFLDKIFVFKFFFSIFVVSDIFVEFLNELKISFAF